MSFAFMPVYSGDYLRDTRHLTPQKHGVYFLLLMYCWDQRGPLPLDEQECAGIANCRSADEIDSLRYILAKFFVRMDDGFYNRRMQQEVEKAQAISVKREDAGRRGANERMRRFREAQALAKQVPSKSQASDATPTTTTTTTTTATKVKDIVGLKPDVAPLKDEAKAILAFLNEKARRNYQPTETNLKFILARFREGYTAAQCRQVVAKKCREWGADEKMALYLRPATLFNSEKFNQYAGELVVVAEEIRHG